MLARQALPARKARSGQESLQSVVSRSIDPTKTAVLTVGAVHAGDAANVIPESAKMLLSVRSFEPRVRQLLEARIRKLAATIAEGYGASLQIDYERGYPVVVNSERETEFARMVAEELVGADKVSTCNLIPGSEDFSYFLERKPAVFGVSATASIPRSSTARNTILLTKADCRRGHVGTPGGTVSGLVIDEQGMTVTGSKFGAGMMLDSILGPISG